MQKMLARMHLSEGQPSPSTGKRQRQSVKATTDLGNLSSRLLYVTDRNSKLKFFIDTGSEVSFISHLTEKHFVYPTGFSLQAANNTKNQHLRPEVSHLRLWTSS